MGAHQAYIIDRFCKKYILFEKLKKNGTRYIISNTMQTEYILTARYGGVTSLHNPQLGGLFGGIGHGGGFFGPRRLPRCYPICKGTQKTLTFFWLLLLVKCRSVSM